MNTATLKECPFCGSAAMLEDHRTIWRVDCASLECGAQVLGDRAPEPDGSESITYWADLQDTAIYRWNARAIAQPVAAGSVEESLPDIEFLIGGDTKRQLIAWGAQQREAGRREGFSQLQPERESLQNLAIISGARAKKAESDVISLQKLVIEAQDRAEKAEADLKARDFFVDVLNCQVKKAEARVNELEAGRHALQAEGKHPAPCARHCEANAFQIEVRRLEAESAHKQAIIDRLMLEYCPDEMTPQKVKEWGEHQVRADPEQMQWQPNRDQRLAGVSNERLHKGYDALRGKDPSVNFDFDVDGKTLTLTRQQIDTELDARDDAPIPF